MATVAEREIIEYYGLPSASPEEWPAGLDASDGSDEEEETSSSRPSLGNDRLKMDRRKSRYFALQGDRRKSVIPGSEKTENGSDNLVPRDEPDPLGTSSSVVNILKRRGLPADRDVRMRNRFLLSSTTFSPGLFLSQVHSKASTQSLLQGLDYLSKSIDQKSASLKVLVESNFERFVRAKATIDNVYNEMRDQGVKGRDKRASGTASKYALSKDNEYGVKSIRAPLAEAAVRAEEVWGPALIGRQREDDLKSVINAMDRHRAIYEVGGNLRRFIRQRDYDAIVAEYTRARRFANDARFLAERTVKERRHLDDEQVHTIIVTGRMWVDVEEQIKTFKQDLWKRLSNIQANSEDFSTEGPVEEYMEIIIALLDLGVDDNPVWVWLLGRYDFLKTKITVFCDRSKVEIEILRRQLLTAEKPTPHKTAPFLRLQNRDGTRSPNERLDRDPVVHWWETVNNYLKKLLSLENGVLGEVLDFWGTIQSFINGEKQKMLPAGFDGESSKHHNLSEENIRELKHGVIELLDLVRTNVYGLFVDAPIEDVSSLVTPSTPIPLQQLASTESQFRPDLKDMPSSTLKAGEFWDDFAFWPPYATSLSGVHYLCQYMALIGTAATEMAASNLVGRGGFFEKLKILISATRERCIRAICAAWNKDAEICKYLEDWERDPERRNVTRMPGVFTSFERCILTGLQKVMFVSEAKGKSRGLEVISAPPSKLLQMVRTQLVTSVYKVLSGMVENAEHPVQPEGQNEWILTGSTTSAVSRENVPSLLIQAGGIDSSNRNVRMLLTLSNLRALRSDYVPLLIANFESFFTVKLTDESNTIFDVLGQIDSRLFQSYTQPTATRLDAEIRKGVTADEWIPPTSRPTEVRPYVFAVMLQLVMVHTEVSTTLPIPWSETNSPGQGSLTYAVLSHLLVRISSSLLAAFTIRQRYSIAALMQATLDTEFIAQTLSQYSSEEASKLQSQIYLELDRRTDSEARNRLQTELGEMRNVLKKLREGTKGEFACFRKVRTQPRGSVA